MPRPPSAMRVDEIAALIEGFDTLGVALAVEPLAGGHIHESYVVTLASPGAERRRVLLQRINTRVFPDVAKLMENVVRVAQHLASTEASRATPPHRREYLRLVATRAGGFTHVTGAGEVWRLMNFIEPSVTYEVARSHEIAERAAFAFGDFQRRLLDLPPPALHETIPNFHDTPRRFEALEAAVASDAVGRAGTAAAAIELARRYEARASALLDLQRAGTLGARVVHNDAKLSNVLFDAASDEPVCVVDLDTVMPGLGLYDFGDLVRSMGNPSREDEWDVDQVEVDPARFAALARGYLCGLGDARASTERDHLVTAAVVITLEQGVRFLTDYLCGDAYYRVTRGRHNLDRARTQLKLVGALLRQERELRAAVSS